jgi:hypothetical protein
VKREIYEFHLKKRE